VERSDLPFGSEFSPSQIGLARVLELAAEHERNWRALEAGIRVEYFDKNPTSEYNRRKLANNCKLGMIAYGVIDREGKLTPFGRKLYEIRGEGERLYAELGRHILVNLHGLSLVQGVRDLEASGESVDLIKLRKVLQELGVHFPSGGKHPSIMRLWLEKAGVFASGWKVNEPRLTELLGESLSGIDAVAGFSSEQKTYLKALANLGSGEHQSNEVARLATSTYGLTFNEKNLPKQVLYPLEKAGYVALTRGTTGRGAKPFMVSPTAKLTSEVLVPIIEQLEKQTAAEVRPLLRRSLDEIVKALRSPDRHARGLALEALAFKLMRLIDLTYIATRLRGSATGGAEVDLIFEGARLVFSRWQIQCNTRRVSLDDLAKEVALTHLTKSQVIVIVTTGEVGSEARRYADLIRGKLPISICFLGGSDLRNVCESPTKIIDLLLAQAPLALCRKEAFSYLAGKNYDRSAAVAVGTRV